MSYSALWRSAARFVPFLAPPLLLLPAIVLGREMCDWDWTPWLTGNIARFQLPRVAVALASLAAALLFVSRTRRRFAIGLAFVAAVVALTVSWRPAHFNGGMWRRFGVFVGGEDAAAWSIAWSGAVLVTLLAAPRQIGSLAAPRSRAFVLGVGALAPPWLAPVAATIMIEMAQSKLHALGTLKCGGTWNDANLGVSAAELWTGLLILVPATRSFGLRFGTLLMQGAAAFGLSQLLQGTSPRGCECFGGLEAPWTVHIAVALVLAAALAAAFIRELKLRAAARCATPPHANLRSRYPAIRTWSRAFLLAHRVRIARFAWVLPAAGVALLVLAIPHVDYVVYDLALALRDRNRAGAMQLATTAATDVAPLVLATYLVRPHLRRDVVDPRVAWVRSAPGRFSRWVGSTETRFHDAVVCRPRNLVRRLIARRAP